MANDPNKSTAEHHLSAAFQRLPGRPLRDAAVLEALVETVAAKVANIERSLERLEEASATREQVQHVYLAVRQTRRLLLNHIEHAKEEARASRIRDEAILTMLGDILARLPSKPGPAEPSSTSTTSSSAASTKPDSSR